MTALHTLPATALLEGYRQRKFSPVDVIDSLLARIDGWEPHLNAIMALEPARVRTEAEASSRRWSAGAPSGALDGVPVTLKETLPYIGLPTTKGSAAFDAEIATHDVPTTARLREAGVIVVAKTGMPELGSLCAGVSTSKGVIRNPWDLSKSTGGSSAGSGAACAAGYAPLHLGTDIGGSVRLPAAACGVVGFKPSNGRVPIDRPFLCRTNGPLTRTVADAALMMSVLAQPDRSDTMSLPPADIDWADLALDLRGLRVGLALEAGTGIPLDPETAAAVSQAAKLFEQAGATIVELPAPLTDEMMEIAETFQRIRQWDVIVSLPPERRAKVLPFVREWAERAALLTGLDISRNMAATMTIRRAAEQLLRQVDFVLSPMTAYVSYPAELPAPNNDNTRMYEHNGYSILWNFGEQPAISLNAGYSQTGFPIGLQIIGQRFDDLGVLRMARAFEDLRGAQRPMPNPPG